MITTVKNGIQGLHVALDLRGDFVAGNLQVIA
jgi:hypothetical protein